MNVTIGLQRKPAQQNQPYNWIGRVLAQYSSIIRKIVLNSRPEHLQLVKSQNEVEQTAQSFHRGLVSVEGISFITGRQQLQQFPRQACSPP
jgi:hypothetical protein